MLFLIMDGESRAMLFMEKNVDKMSEILSEYLDF